MSSVIADFNKEDFFEQGFRFTICGERTWSVEVLESWSSLGETWRRIGHVMQAKNGHSWVAICLDNLSFIGFSNRSQAAQHLEIQHYAQH